MLSLIGKLNKKISRKTYLLPEGCRVYAIGDIHGRADLLDVLHQAIATHAQHSAAVRNFVVYLGDYLDRGPYVKETIQALTCGPLCGFESTYLMGNHERLFLDFIENTALLEMWLGMGGQSTLMSYGVRAPGLGFSPRRAKRVKEALVEAIPPRHLEFLKNLKPYFRLGDYLFVHAGIRPGVSLKHQAFEDFFWIRDAFTACSAASGFCVVHGHTICEGPQTCSHRIGVDTGAYATGILTCAVIEGQKVDFLSASTSSRTLLTVSR